MGTISRNKTWVAGEVLNAADLNGELNTAYNVINGSLDANNLASDAVTTAKILNANVTKAKLGTMEYIVAFSYPNTISASAENIRQVMFPYAGTLTKIELINGHDCTAFAIDIGKALINSSSIGSSFFAAGSANVTASGSVLSVTGASLTNTTIAANTKFIITAKTFSSGSGPLLANVFIDV